MGVESSLVTIFTDSASESASVSIQLDEDHPNNKYTDSSGEVHTKSTFLPTDNPVVLLNHSPSVRITDIKFTHGYATVIGENISRSQNSDALFGELGSKINISTSNVSGVSFTGTCSVELVDEEGSFSAEATGGTFPSYGDLSFTVLHNKQVAVNFSNLELSEDETQSTYLVVYVESI